MTQDSNEQVFCALKLAFQAAERWLVNGHIDIPDLDPDLEELNFSIVPVVQIEGWKSYSAFGNPSSDKEKFLGYKFEGKDITKPLRLAKENARAFDLLIERVQANLVLGHALDDLLGTFACEVLAGRITRPNVRGGKPATIERNTLLIAVVEEVFNRHGISRTSDEQLRAEDDRLLLYGSNIAWFAFEMAGVKPARDEFTPERAAKIVRNDRDARKLARENPYIIRPKPSRSDKGLNAFSWLYSPLSYEVSKLLRRATKVFATT